MSKPLLLRILSTTLSISGRDHSLRDFAAGFLRSHEVSAADVVDVSVEFDGFLPFLRTPRPPSLREGEERLGYGIHWRESILRYADHELEIECGWDSSSGPRRALSVRGGLRVPMQRSLRAFTNKNLKRALLMQAYRRFILWPASIVEYERRRAVLVHGLMLEREGRGLLLVGLGGVGKTRIASGLRSSGWSVLSDNYLFFDGSHAWGVREPMRFDKSDMRQARMLAQSVDSKVTDEGGRIAVHGIGAVREKALVTDAFLISYGRTPSLSVIDVESFVRKTELYSSVLREFGLDSYPRFVMERDGYDFRDARETLARLGVSARLAEVRVGLNEPIESVLERICGPI